MTEPQTLKIDDVEYVRADAQAPAGDEVIIRTYSAGVHVGVLKERNGQEIVLKNARRIWSWKGAFTLNEIAVSGLERKGSRISNPVPEITLLQSIEIIPVSKSVDLSSTEK